MLKLTIACSLVGIALIYLGLTSSGLGQLSAWLGLGFCLTGLGYRKQDARIYGKQQSGQFPLWSTLLYCPFFLYTLAIWHLVQLLIKENAFDWILPDIVIGRRLAGKKQPEDIVNYVDLTAEFYEPKHVIEKYHYVSLPILDGSVPEIDRLTNAIDSLSPGITYIHCGQGHGRTGLFTAILLYRRGEVATLDEALALLKSKRPKLSLTQQQRQFVSEFIKRDTSA